MELKIEYLPIETIAPYENNAKVHTAEQIEQIKKSIEDYGMNDPIGIWHDTIVEGHGRLMACLELGYTEVPVIRLDHMTDEQRREYMLVHNQTTMNTGYDFDLLSLELEELTDFDAEAFGFVVDFDNSETDQERKYTKETKVPQYEPTGETVDIEELLNDDKAFELVREINDSNVTKEEKEFLKIAASRHVVFDYRKIAEYYANATQEMQALMEQSALVIVDIDDAIANGYAKLAKRIEVLRSE